MQIIYRRVQNFSRSRQGQRPEAIVIHMADDNTEDALEKFNNPLLRNSAHYLVTREGQIWRLVEETDTAWHAGGVQKASWKLLKPDINPNLYTIGIAHEGNTGEPWTDAMYQSSAQLIANIGARWDIPLDRDHIIGHSQINSLHSDPGLAVDFQRLISQANSIYEDDHDAVIDEESKSEANLRNRLSTVQLSMMGIENENKKLKSEVASLNPEKYVQIQNQNLALSEEVYSLQQQYNELKSKFDTLHHKYQSLSAKRLSHLSEFSIRELLSAIIRRIRTRN